VNQPFLPYGAQSIDEDDIAAVVATLRSPYLTTGPKVAEFEAAVADYVGAAAGVAVCNGTAALHATCHALGLGPGDEVVVPALTFLATANCVRYVGATPVFADVCPDSGLVTAETVTAAISPRTRAVLPVHLTGRPVDLAPIRALTEARGIALVEDAAHALGATYQGQPIGNGQCSEMAIFSFHPVKHMTTGEGGMVVTNDPKLEERLRRFRNHGMVRSPEALQRESPGPWYYEQQELGYNYRITDIQCALGLSQLKRLDHFLLRRRQLAARYDQLFADCPQVHPVAPGGHRSQSAYHLYSVLVDFDALGRSRADVMGQLRAAGIGTQVHYIPVPHQPYYQALGGKQQDYPGAADYYRRTLSLPLFPRMDDDDVDRVVDALSRVLGD
tara:strand:- start:1462 stop:2622 length:1161 start_codon:yes stop_codon:yes gene_type:complete